MTPTRPLAPRNRWGALIAITGLVAALLISIQSPAAAGTAAPAATVGSTVTMTSSARAASACSVAESGAAIPRKSLGVDAVRTTIGVAKTMGVSTKGQIIAVMVMYQESSIRNLANDGSSVQASSWPSPGRAYWMNVTKLSLKYPHDKFGLADGAHDTDSIGLYQQRPAWGWGNYGNSTGITDPEGAVQRLLDPRWEAMAFFGGTRSAAPTSGLLDVNGWEGMAPTDAAEAVQGSTQGDLYAKWEIPATAYVNNNSDAPPIDLPWFPGGGGGALACTSIPVDPRLGEAGHNPLGALDSVTLQGNTIRVAGWAFDPDAINGIGVIHFYDQGPFGTTGYPTGVANQSREDVNRAFNIVGQYGYITTLPSTGPGLHTICAYGINVGRGNANSQLGCGTIAIPGPVGSLDLASRNSSNQIDVAGWAADPAAPGSREEVHIYVSGPNGTMGTAGTLTGGARPDVSAVYPWAGPAQGFGATVPSMGGGTNKVCVYAINVNPPRSNPLLGCRTVAIEFAVVGVVDSIAVSGRTALVSGWTFDPNSPAASIQVHIYVNPGIGHPFVADDPRPDVNSVMQVAGQHGFSRSVALAAGANTVCTYGIGVAAGNNTLIDCRVVQA